MDMHNSFVYNGQNVGANELPPVDEGLNYSLSRCWNTLLALLGNDLLGNEQMD